MLSYLLLLLLSSYRAVIHNVPRKRLLRKILLWPFYSEGDTQLLVDNHDCYERQDIIENTENYIVNNNDKIKLLECQNQLLYLKNKVILVRLYYLNEVN